MPWIPICVERELNAKNIHAIFSMKQNCTKAIHMSENSYKVNATIILVKDSVAKITIYIFPLLSKETKSMRIGPYKKPYRESKLQEKNDEGEVVGYTQLASRPTFVIGINIYIGVRPLLVMRIG